MKSSFRFLYMAFGLCTIAYPVRAQWVQSSGPPANTGFVRALAVSPASGGAGSTNLFAGNDGGNGVFLSTNNGTSWITANTGLSEKYIEALAVSGVNLFAGTGGGGIFLSTNNGTNWTAVDSGLTNLTVWSFAVSGANLYAGTAGGVFLSTNNGTSWSPASAGLTNNDVRTFAVIGANIFAGTLGGGVFLSTNNGTSWNPVNVGLTNADVISFAVIGTNLFAGTFGRVFLSTNSGANWSPANSGLTYFIVYSLVASGSNLFAGTNGGVFVSTNNGGSWTQANTGLTDTPVSLAVSGTYLFAGTDTNRVWRRPLSEMATAVERISTDLPTRFSLSQNYPNPFNPATIISFGLPSKSFVSLEIFDALGRAVATIVSEELSAGIHRRQWTATGVSSGIYFCRLQAGSLVETKKLVLLR